MNEVWTGLQELWSTLRDVPLIGSYLRYIVPAAGVWLLWRFTAMPRSKIYKATFARFMANMQKDIGKMCGKEKKLLFGGLKKMADDITRPLRVLEIGAGSGGNFQYYPEDTRVICLDPNPYFDSYLRESVSKFPHIVLEDSVLGVAEDMSNVPDNSVDAVVCTMVLCSVQNEQKVLKEVHRILKPGGTFFFVEHVGASSGSWLLSAQQTVTPLWRYLFDNCNLNRNSEKLLDGAGFEKFDVTHFRNLKTWMVLLSCMCYGTATKERSSTGPASKY